MQQKPASKKTAASKFSFFQLNKTSKKRLPAGVFSILEQKKNTFIQKVFHS
jgi:hypothetical protein